MTRAQTRAKTMNAPAMSPSATACEVASAPRSTAGRYHSRAGTGLPRRESGRAAPVPSQNPGRRPPMIDYRKYAAEFLGTFVLVFAGTTAIVAAGRSSLPPIIFVPFAFGLALLAGLYAFGEVSGGHFNPAVSIAMFLDKRLPSSDLGGYLISQFLGGIAAALLLLILTSKKAVASTATVPMVGTSDLEAFVLELVFPAIFVAVILQASRSEAFGTSALLAIPLTLV